MAHKIEVAMQRNTPDPAGESVRAQLAEDIGVSVDEIRVIDVYTINADLSSEELELVRTELLTDPIIQESVTDQSIAQGYDYLIEVGFRPGVTDNVGKSAAEGVADTLGRAGRGRSCLQVHSVCAAGRFIPRNLRTYRTRCAGQRSDRALDSGNAEIGRAHV
mgnify:CR=1 FL=1